MPNHYHLLIKQIKNDGIEIAMKKTLISTTLVYNTIHNRKGPVFLTQFKAKRIKSEEQLIYVSRYIHTNPYSSKLVKNINDIFSYRFSSIRAYSEHENVYNLDINTILYDSIFKGNIDRYKKYLTVPN